MKKVRILENKSEIAAGTRGSSVGVEALKVAGWNAKDNFLNNYSWRTIKDQNQLLYEENKTPAAIRIEGVVKVYEEVIKELNKCLQEGDFPLLISADHASAGGTIAGIKNAYPEKRLGVVWIDAHGDLHSPYTSPTGNIHGMPLATALGVDNLSCKIREVDQQTAHFWEMLKQVGGISPKIAAEDLVFFGVRDTEKPEDHLIEQLNITNYKVEECREVGIPTLIEKTKQKLKDCDLIYISFDVDSMDSEEVSKGTGTPVPHGFLPSEVNEIIQGLVKMEELCCFEIVEINPTLDEKGNAMAEVAFNILKNVVLSIEKQLNK